MPISWGGRRNLRRLSPVLVLVAGALLVAFVATATALRGGTSKPKPAVDVGSMAAAVVATQGQCEGYTETPENKTNGTADETCLAHAAYTIIGKSTDPSTLLPQVDAIIQDKGGFLGSMCHLVMHLVGRQ